MASERLGCSSPDPVVAETGADAIRPVDWTSRLAQRQFRFQVTAREQA